MDTTLLTETIVKSIKRPISLRWMRISDGSSWDPDRDTTKDPRAIHIETAVADKDEVKRCLQFLYGSKSKDFPLRIRMRFVPVIQSFVDIDTLVKCKELRNRQHGWITQHVAKTTYDLVNLDHKDKDLGKTLRNIIMDIPSTSGNKETPLFLSIDKSWKGGGYTFSFHPDKRDEANMTIKGMYPRLAYIYGDKIHKCFTPPAIVEGMLMTWDPVTKKVSSEADREVNALLAMDDDMTILIPTSTEDETIGNRKIVFRKETTDDSVLTFTDGSKRPLPGEITVQTKKKHKTSSGPMDIDNDQASRTDSKVSSRASDNSSLSFSTRKTMDSRISVMEHGLTQLTALMNQVLTQTAQPQTPNPKPNKDQVTPVTPRQTQTSEDKASNPSTDGSKPEEPGQGDSGVS